MRREMTNSDHCLHDETWSDVKDGEHLVQFYEDDEFLLEAVITFVGGGLGAGAGAIVIATPAHREALANRLRAHGIDVAGVQARGQYVPLDAAETLSKFMVDGMPDKARFNQIVGGVVAKASQGFRELRAFGEMVALLWADGNESAAIRLEGLWNELSKAHSFSLLCAYPIDAFGSEANSEPFLHICKEHSRVLPAESYARRDGSEDTRLRTIAVLQQKAAALEAEIAERKQAEKELARRERELCDFLENATEGIHQVSADGTILWANQAEIDLLGYTAEEYVGHSITEFHADADVIADILARLKNGEKLREYEARLRRKDGSIRYVAINSSVYWEDGRFVHTKCFTRDITERKNQDTASQLLRAIVEFSEDAIVSKDLNGVITSWNKGAERLFGYTAAEVIGQPVTILMPPERMNEEAGILAEIRQGRCIEHYETVRRRKDGTLLNISLTVSPIKDAQGKVVGVSKIGRDITERAQAREHLEQTVSERTAQLQDAVAELEAFSYSIAHDMRAPLRAMHSYSRFLEEDFSEALPMQGKTYARRIASGAERLDALITDVLNYSKISRGEMVLETLDVEKITRDIIDSYPNLAESCATILVRSPIPLVMGNAAALGQCLSNLLSNAVKFVAPGISPQVRVWAEERGGNVRLWVEDNGIGISEEGQKRIFNMFQRLNPARDFEGMGIGLTIVRKAVQRMGGRVGLESQPGVGSRFWIELKRAS